MKKDNFDYVRPLLALTLVICSVALIFVLCFHKITPENKDMLNIFIGIILGAAATSVTYYFGSSKSSSDKDNTIANSTPNILPKQEGKA